MALHNVGQVKSAIQAILQGINLEKVGDLNGAIERGARTLVQQASVPEASGRDTITLYNGVRYYLAPETIFGGSLNLIRQQGDTANPLQYTYKVPVDVFSRTSAQLPNGYLVDFEYEKGVGLMGITSPIPLPKVVLSTMSDGDDWTATGSASTPVTDQVNYWDQPASIRFNLTGASTGAVATTLSSTIDLTSYQGVGVVFLAIETPSGTDLTNIQVRLGSTSTDYYATATETEGFLGAWQSDTWLLVAFDLSAVSTTGSPNIGAIDYIQVLMAHTATLSNFRLGGVWVSMPSLNEILYQSSAIFRTPAGALSQSITSDGDTIVLNDAAYTLFEYEAALAVALQQGGSLASNFIQSIRAILFGSGEDVGLYNRYRADNPSAVLRTLDSYYDSSWGSGYGNRW